MAPAEIVATWSTSTARIKKLGDSGRITPELAEWAQGLRGIRNEATHEEDPLSDDDIEKLAAATRLLLTYLFTLPAMLAEVSGNPAVVPAPPAKAKP